MIHREDKRNSGVIDRILPEIARVAWIVGDVTVRHAPGRQTTAAIARATGANFMERLQAGFEEVNVGTQHVPRGISNHPFCGSKPCLRGPQRKVYAVQVLKLSRDGVAGLLVRMSHHLLPLVGARLNACEKCNYTWTFAFTTGDVIQTESPWRLTNTERIVITSGDNEQQFGLPNPVDAAASALESIGDARVAEVSIIEGASDLLLRFANGVRLEFLNLSSGYEAWRAIVEGKLVVCMGGGGLTAFPKPPPR